MPPKAKLMDRLCDAAKIDQKKMSVKLTVAPKLINKSSFKVFMKNVIVQADLIYMLMMTDTIIY